MAAINRYHGNSGRRERIPEALTPGGERVSPLPPSGGGPGRPGEMAPERAVPRDPVPSEHRGSARQSAQGPGAPRREKPPGPLYGLRSGLDGMLSKLDPGRLETEDLLILVVLYLLYRESGDTELLIALGAFLFL